MTPASVRKVRALAAEVVALCDEVENVSSALHVRRDGVGELTDWERGWVSTGKFSGELRRRSMDLTRALADLRRR
jgi:hypothetical protein